MEYTDMERRILDMWPKYEDGSYVWFGDKAVANSGRNEGKEFTVGQVYFENEHDKLLGSVSDGCYWNYKSADPYVKRPAPKVLDADGVEIKVGDTVWHEDGRELRVIGFDAMQDGETVLIVEYAAEPTKLGEVRCLSVTHTRPDSWERLERDAEKSICDYFGSSSSPGSLCEDGCPGLNSPVNCGVLMKLDLIRRAKALAEKEAAR